MSECNWKTYIKDHDYKRWKYSQIYSNNELPQCITRSGLIKRGDKLLEHQLDTITLFNQDSIRSLLVWHEMGLGKTLTALMISQCFIDNYLHANVVVLSPASLVENFQKEMNEKYLLENMRKRDRYQFNSYDSFHKDTAKSKKVTVNEHTLLILDEFHSLKNTSAKKFKEVLNIAGKCKKVLLLSATPYFNDRTDFNAVIKMLHFNSPSYNAQDFIHEDTNLNCIAFHLVGYCSFMKKEINNTDYPTVEFKERVIKMTIEEEKEYLKLTQEIYEKMKGRGLENKIFTNRFLHGPRVLGIKYNIGKINYILARCYTKGFKTVIYTNWVKNDVGTEFIVKKLLDLGYKQYFGRETRGVEELVFAEITGNIDKKDLNKIVKLYNKNLIDILILSPAGGEGLDLKETRQIFILDPPFTEAELQQILGRAIRFKSHSNLPKEDQNVSVYKMISAFTNEKEKQTGDQILYNIIKRKREEQKQIEDMIKEISLFTPSFIIEHAKDEI